MTGTYLNLCLEVVYKPDESIVNVGRDFMS